MVNLFGVYHYCYTGAGVLAGVYCTSGRSVKLPKPLGPLEMDLAESVIGRWGILCPVSIAKIYLVTTINITLMLAFQEFIGSQGKWIQFETRSYYALPWTLFATWTYAYSGSKTGMGTRRDYPCSIGMLVVLAGIVYVQTDPCGLTHSCTKQLILALCPVAGLTMIGWIHTLTDGRSGTFSSCLCGVSFTA